MATLTPGAMMTKANEAQRQTRAKNRLRTELKQKGVSFRDLVEKLTPLDVEETERNIENKISQARFTTVYYCNG